MGEGIDVGKPPISSDLEKLRTLYASNASWRSMFDDFASRTNNQRLTKVDQIQNRLRAEGVPRREVISLFRKLEEFGHGQFIEGRKGHPSRFVWSSSPIAVGKAAQGDEAPIPGVSVNSSDEEADAELRKYIFPLRSGVDAIIQLPADLTVKESERLGAFVRTLAVSE